MRKSPKHGAQSKQRSRVISARKHIPHAPSVKAIQRERLLSNQSEGIFESLPEGVIACDRDGKIARMNTSALKLFEEPSEALYRGTDYHQFLQHYRSVYEKEYICKDGSRLPVLVCGVILQHHPFQAIGFVLDNSARKELEQRKDDFISMANHGGTISVDSVVGKGSTFTVTLPRTRDA